QYRQPQQPLRRARQELRRALRRPDQGPADPAARPRRLCRRSVGHDPVCSDRARDRLRAELRPSPRRTREGGRGLRRQWSVTAGSPAPEPPGGGEAPSEPASDPGWGLARGSAPTVLPEDRLDPDVAILDGVPVILQQDRAALAGGVAGATGRRVDL